MRYLLLAAPTIALCACAPASEANPDAALGSDQQTTRDDAGADGPFGIAMNRPLPEGLGAEEKQPNIYEIKAPPKSHPDFEAVIAVSFPSTGVCTLRGIGRDLNNDGAGANIRSKVDQLAQALQTKYGKGEKFDVCAGGDIQCASDYWMMILNSGERAYGTKWESQNAEMKRLGLGSIYVGAGASDIQTSYPILEFNSANEDGCKAAEAKAGASAL